MKNTLKYNMFDKALKLCDPWFLNDNIALVKKTLLNNHYPLTFIEIFVKKRLENLKRSDAVQTSTLETLPDKVYNIVAPYISRVAHEIKRVNKKFTSEKNKFDTIFNNQNKSDTNFDKIKDKDAIGLKWNSIYNIFCKDCDKVYIGQTKR